MKEENNIENRLSKLKNSGSFKTPENFFENFEKEVLSKTVDKKKSNNLIYLIGVAASIALLLGAYFIKSDNNSFTDSINTIASNKIDTSELYAEAIFDELEDINFDYSDDIIYDIIDEEAITESLESIDIEENEEVIMEFLMSEEIDIYEIITADPEFSDLLCEKC